MRHRGLAAVARWRGSSAPLALAAGAWAVIVASAMTGNGAVINHARLIRSGLPLWAAALVFVAGWQVMLWAMMVPASLDAIEWRRDVRDRAVFLAGYLATWTAFGLVAFVLDAGLHAAVNHSPWLTLHPWPIAGGVLLLVGSYQLSSLKAGCLAACGVPPPIEHREQRESLRDGVGYGVKCLGASGGLMLLAFALGAGSLPMMLGLTAVMVWEAAPWGSSTIRLTGYALIAAGFVVTVGPIQGLPLLG